jgi:SAM-dependent methyltransferase
LNLGKHPPSDAFLKKEQLGLKESVFPLEVYFCHNCNLVQLKEVVSGDILFRHYPYMTSVSARMKAHLEKLAQNTVKRFALKKTDLVIDIGSNDGTLLKFFKNLGVKTLGVDPSDVAKLSRKNGIETVNDFFNQMTAKKIVEEFGQAKIITGTNVFAHVDNLDDFMRGINTLLDRNGVLILEFPYLIDLLENLEFDTIYHEHLSYFSVTPLIRLFDKFDLKLFDCQRMLVHGGSIRIFVKEAGLTALSVKVKSLIKLEKQKKQDSINT